MRCFKWCPVENSEKNEYLNTSCLFWKGTRVLVCKYVCLFVLMDDDNNQNKMMHTSDIYNIYYNYMYNLILKLIFHSQSLQLVTCHNFFPLTHWEEKNSATKFLFFPFFSPSCLWCPDGVGHEYRLARASQLFLGQSIIEKRSRHGATEQKRAFAS